MQFRQYAYKTATVNRQLAFIVTDSESGGDGLYSLYRVEHKSGTRTTDETQEHKKTTIYQSVGTSKQNLKHPVLVDDYY